MPNKTNIKQFQTILYFIIIISCLASIAKAEMQSMDDKELSQITAQAGVKIFVDAAVQYNADSIKFSDTDTDSPDWLEFKGFSLDDGAGGQYLLRTPIDDPVTINVATNSSGKTYTDLNFSQLYSNPKYIHADSLVFCEKDLGSVDIKGLKQTSDHLRFSAHTDGSVGIDWDYSTKIDIDSMEYTYNNQGNALALNGIHFAKTASGSPEDPDSWGFDGDFTIGNIEEKPATFDVGTTSSGEQAVVLGLPMQGAIRVNEITFGNSSFGPCAIDGINVHRLSAVLMSN